MKKLYKSFEDEYKAHQSVVLEIIRELMLCINTQIIIYELVLVDKYIDQDSEGKNRPKEKILSEINTEYRNLYDRLAQAHEVLERRLNGGK